MSKLRDLTSNACCCAGSAARTVALILGLLAVTVSAARPQQWRSFGNDFLVLHQLSSIVISRQEAEQSRIFVDPVRNVSSDESQQLRDVVVDSLRQKMQVVDKNEQPNFGVQIILQEHRYPFTNASREQAHGSLTFAICRYPIKASERDCENFVYYYFFDSARVSLFGRVLSLWIDEVFSPK